jgi:hypothetical protein
VEAGKMQNPTSRGPPGEYRMRGGLFGDDSTTPLGRPLPFYIVIESLDSFSRFSSCTNDFAVSWWISNLSTEVFATAESSSILRKVF